MMSLLFRIAKQTRPASQTFMIWKGRLSPGEALDEAKGGKTLRGTPVTRRTEYCFPAEARDLLWQMDLVASGDKGELKPLNFDENGDNKVDVGERDAIRGRNTWLLWGAGNEAFWGWLQESAYALTDFRILMDSRKRGDRFSVWSQTSRRSK